MSASQELLNERAFSKLRWRSRRGLLENDLLIEKFFNRFESSLTVGQAKGMADLMELSDNDLLDLLLRRKEPHQLLKAILILDDGNCAQASETAALAHQVAACGRRGN